MPADRSAPPWVPLALVLGGFLGCIGVSDFDGDGALDEIDCVPDDASIYPGAPEVCDDGIDQDCDGRVDLLDPDCWIRNGALDEDDDGDGVTEEEGDCDDTRPDVYPGAPETCGDGLDNDCNGIIDDCPDEGQEPIVSLLLEVRVRNATGGVVPDGLAAVIWGEWDARPPLVLGLGTPVGDGTVTSLGEQRLELSEGERYYRLSVGLSGEDCWVGGGYGDPVPNPYVGFENVFGSATLELVAERYESPCPYEVQAAR